MKVFLFAVGIIYLQILSFCVAEEENPCKKIFGVVPSSKTAAEIFNNADDTSGIEAISTLSTHFEKFRKPLEEKNATSGSDLHCIDRVDKQDELTKYIGFGSIEGCVVKSDDEETEASSIIKAIKDLMKWAPDLKDDLILNSYGRNWENSYANEEYFLDEGHARECYGYRALGYRVNEVWGIRTSFYNESYSTDVKDDRREIITEYITNNNGTLGHLRMKIPECSEKTLVSTEEYSVMSTLRSGVTKWDYGDRDTNSQNYEVGYHFGILEALGKTAHRKELLQDSGEPSNIAVLVLPALLALFPIGIFQEASIGTIFMYSVATDVVSVLPILIKAGELLHFGRKNYYGLHTQFHGQLDGDATSVGQVFPAVCKFKPWIATLGYILLAVGLGLMLLGLVLEVLTMRAVKKRKGEWNSDPDRSPTKELHGLLWYASQDSRK